MNRIAWSCLAIFFVPWLSGCCCCGGHDYCSSMSSGGYNDCLSYDDAYRCNDCGRTSKRGNCNCQGSDDFSLPPEPSSYPMQTGTPYGTYYGPEIVGPEVVGPEYVPNSTEWYDVAPTTPVAPAPPANAGSTAPGTPTPIPAISNGTSVVVPPPAPPATSSTSTGPMMPPVPPPPAEPVSQMRFRQYR